MGSWFSGMCRAEIDQYHHLANRYFNAYAKEISYREDNRRVNNETVMRDVLK